MPKSKVRKKTVYTPPVGERSTTPVKVAGPSHPLYLAVMLGLGLIGLAWMVVDYLAREKIDVMQALGSYNLLIGFGLIVVALFMSMRWR